MPFPIDVRTIFIVFSISNLLIALFLYGFIRLTHHSDKIFTWFLLSKGIYTISYLLFGFREIIPSFISVLIANILLLFSLSLEIFCLKNISNQAHHNALKKHLLLTVLLAVAFSIFSQSVYKTRVFINSLILAILYLQGALPLMRVRPKFSLAYVTGVIYLIMTALVTYRAINTFIFPDNSTFLQSNTAQLIIIVSVYQVSIFSTFLLFLISKEKDSQQLINQNEIIENDNQLLKKLNTTKNKFMSIISHDLRGPLGNIENLSFLMQDKENSFSEEEKDYYLKVIQQSASQANRLLNNLLFWSLSESDTIRFHPHAFSLTKIIEEATTLLSPLAVKKHIELKRKTEKCMNVYGDLEMINTIIRNLISNAIKYSYPHSKIVIRCYPHQDNMIKTDVIDDGVGLTQDQINKIFTSSSFHSSKGTNNESGTGLGLKLSIDFAQRNGGELTIESTPGKGSCFSFTLPTASE